jgi:hypothetical protein
MIYTCRKGTFARSPPYKTPAVKILAYSVPPIYGIAALFEGFPVWPLSLPFWLELCYVDEGAYGAFKIYVSVGAEL